MGKWLFLFLGALSITAMGMFPSLLFSQPKVTVLGGTEFNFGDVFSGSVVKRSVTIQNMGVDTLKISNVSTSCGCTATLLSRNEIPPDDSGRLEITFDSKKFTGKVEKAVTFETNDPVQNKVRIIFHATISKVVELAPDHIVYNVIKLDTATTKEVTITNVSEAPVKIISANTESDEITLKLSSTELPPGHRSTLSCTIVPKVNGFKKGTIILTIDNKKMPKLEIRYFGLVK